jgi:hypothetical protein
MMDLEVELIQVMTCLPTLPVYQCNECLQWTEAARDRCHYCNSTQITPEWRLDFEIRAINASTCQFLPHSPRVAAMGSMLDPVMGMTIEEYLSLTRKFRPLNDLVQKYFEFTFLNVIRIDGKLISVYVPAGCQLTFRVWLGFQRPFDNGDLETELLSGCEPDEME